MAKSALISFDFNSHAVRAFEHSGEPWFVAKDVCDALGYDHVPHAMRLLDNDEKDVQKVDTLGGKQTVRIISESGVYCLAERSRKPEARRFSRWVRKEVLPSIRKTGSYGASLKPVTYTKPHHYGEPEHVGAPRNDRAIKRILLELLTWGVDNIDDSHVFESFHGAIKDVIDLQVTCWTEIDEALIRLSGAKHDIDTGMEYLNRWQGRHGRIGNVANPSEAVKKLPTVKEGAA